MAGGLLAGMAEGGTAGAFGTAGATGANAALGQTFGSNMLSNAMQPGQQNNFIGKSAARYAGLPQVPGASQADISAFIPEEPQQGQNGLDFMQFLGR